jgi:hypothetical protein
VAQISWSLGVPWGWDAITAQAHRAKSAAIAAAEECLAKAGAEDVWPRECEAVQVVHDLTLQVGVER